jgi:hypothetical protein
MKRQDKIDKLICVLNTNIDKLEVDGTSLKFKFNLNYGNKDRIEIYSSYKTIPEITESKFILGFRFGNKVIKKESQEPAGRIYSFIDGSSFGDYVDIEVFNGLYNRAVERRDKRFIELLNTLCNEEKK